MLEERYYAIDIFSNEWWINNSITSIIIIILFKVAMMYKRSEKVKDFNYFLGSLLLLRFFWVQWYHYSIGIWNIQWSLPLQLCSFSSLLSGTLPIIENFKIKDKYKQLFFEFLFYYSIGAFYALITPVYTAGNQGLIYYEYYISHGGIIFTTLYFIFVLGYQPRKKSWLKIFGYSQILLVAVHIVNIIIGGQSNYFYTVEPPIANNPLVIGAYPTHILLLDLFALGHFYLMNRFLRFIKKK